MTRHLNGPALNKNTAEADRFWYNELPIQYDPDYVYFMDDFLNIGLDANTPFRWTVISDTGASASIEADTIGGRLVLAPDGNEDNEGSSIQGNEIWAVAVGRYLWLETRVKLTDADDMDFNFGFTENFATNPEAMRTSSNRIVFEVVEGDASIQCITEASDSATTTDSQVDAGDDTFVTLGIRCIGTGVVEFYVNRVLKATHTTNIPTANLAIGAYSLCGTTSVDASTYDYIMAAMTR